MATYKFKCPKCGFTKIKASYGLITAFTAKKAPKCPECKTRMKMVGKNVTA